MDIDVDIDLKNKLCIYIYVYIYVMLTDALSGPIACSTRPRRFLHKNCAKIKEGTPGTGIAHKI